MSYAATLPKSWMPLSQKMPPRMIYCRDIRRRWRTNYHRQVWPRVIAPLTSSALESRSTRNVADRGGHAKPLRGACQHESANSFAWLDSHVEVLWKIRATHWGRRETRPNQIIHGLCERCPAWASQTTHSNAEKPIQTICGSENYWLGVCRQILSTGLIVYLIPRCYE